MSELPPSQRKDRKTPQEKEVEWLFLQYRPAIRQAASEIDSTGTLIVVALEITGVPVRLISLTWADCEELLATCAVGGLPPFWPTVKRCAEDHPEFIPAALLKDFGGEDNIEWYFSFVDPRGELPQPGQLVRDR